MRNTDLINIGLIDAAAQLRRITADQLLGMGFSVVIEADNGQGVLQKIEESKKLPDICIVDEDFSAASLLLEKYPELKVLISSTEDNEKAVRNMLEKGIAGYVLKFNDPDELATAVNALSNDKRYFSVGVAKIAREYFSNI